MKLKQARLNKGAFRREPFFKAFESKLDKKVIDIDLSYNRAKSDTTGSDLYQYVAVLEDGQEVIFWTNADTGMVEDIYFQLDSKGKEKRVIAHVNKKGDKLKLSESALAREVNRLVRTDEKRKLNRTFKVGDVAKVIDEVNKDDVFLELEKQLTKGSGFFIVVADDTFLSTQGAATRVKSEIQTFKKKDEAIKASKTLENSKVVEI